MTTFQSVFGAYFTPVPLNLGQFEATLSNFLQGLKELHPSLSQWYLLGDRMNQEQMVEDEAGHVHDKFRDYCWDKYAPKDWFTFLDADGRPTTESTSRTGWTSSLTTEPQGNETPNFAHLLVAAGGTSTYVTSSATLKVPNPDSPLLAPDVSDRLIRYMIEFWNADSARVVEREYRERVRSDRALEQVGRLNYRRDASIAAKLPDVVPRELFHGGVLFRIGEGRPLGPHDETEVELGEEVARILTEVGPTDPALP